MARWPRLVLLLLSGALLAGEEAWAQEPSQVLERDQALQSQASSRLVSGAYDFCTNPSFRLWREDKQELCGQTPPLLADCSGLALACRKPAWEDQPPEDSGWNFGWFEDFFAALGIGIDSLARALFWLVLVVGLAWLAKILLQRWSHRGSEAAGVQVASSPAAPTILFEGDDRSADELLTAARTLLDQGARREALHLLYRATIVTLAEVELIRVHKSKTTRDYVDELNGPLQSEVADLTSALDGQRFRPGSPPATTALTLAEQVRQLRLKTVGQQLARALPLLLAMQLTACSGLEIPEDPHAPRGTRGFTLFEELLAHKAAGVSRRIRRVTAVNEETNTIVALDAPLTVLDWRVVRAWVQTGGHLVVVEPNAEFQKAFGIDVHSEICTAALLAPHLHVRSVGPTLAFAPHDRGEVRLSCGSRSAADVVAHGEGWITRVASRSLFENRSLAVADNATLALALTSSEYANVELWGSWTGGGSHHPLESLRRAGLGPWALHLMVLLGLYALARGRRFGTPRDPGSNPRRAFAEHVEALAAQYARAGASGFALGRYAEWAWETLRRRVTSQQDTTRSVARALGDGDAGGAELGRSLALARKAGELGETEKQHLERFRMLEDAVARTRPR